MGAALWIRGDGAAGGGRQATGLASGEDCQTKRAGAQIEKHDIGKAKHIATDPKTKARGAAEGALSVRLRVGYPSQKARRWFEVSDVLT